jgi:hypothetical protein
MRLLDFGSIVTALSIAEWFVWAAIAMLFGKRTLVVAFIVAKRILLWSTVAFATLTAALFVLATLALIVAIL